MHFPLRFPIGFVALLSILICACGGGGEQQESGSAALQSVQVRAARVVMPPPGASMAAGYFELDNPGATALVLESLESTAFDSVEMHETVDDNGVSRMRPLANATIAPGATLRFEPGGMHLMLTGMELPSDAAAPASVPMKLRLRAAAGGQTRELETTFAVERRDLPQLEDPHAHDHHH